METTVETTKTIEVRLKWDQLNPGVVDRHLEKVGLNPPGDVKARAIELQRYYLLHTDPASVLTCDGCGGDSPEDLTECPFCGTGGVSTELAPETTGEPASEPDPEPKAAAVIQLKPSEAKEAVQSKKATAAAKKAAAAAKKEADAAAAEEAEKPKTNGVHAAADPEEVDVTAVVVQSSDAPTDAIVVENAEELNEAVSRIHKLRAEARVSMWDLGHELKQIYDRDLFKQRIGPDGQPKYKTWTQFVQAELDFTHRYSFLLMDAAVAFTREDVAQIGMGKLQILVTVPDQYKAELLERAKQNAPREELLLRAREITGSTGPRETGRTGFRKGQEKIDPPKKAKKGEQAGKLGSKGRPEGSVAIVLLARRSTVQLFKRKPEDVRAKRVADEPHGKVELADGSFLHVRIAADNKGQLKAIIEVASE